MKNLLKIGMAVLMFMIMLVPAMAAVEGGNGYKQTLSFFNQTGSAVNNIDFIGYKCSDDACNTLNGPFGTFKTGVKNTGNSNTAEVRFTKTKTSTDFGLWFDAGCYLPFEFAQANYFYNPNKPNFNFPPKDFTLEVGQGCKSPVTDLILLNTVNEDEPMQIDVVADLSADIRGAFKNKGPLNSFPTEMTDAYSVETLITIEIRNATGSVVFSDTQTTNIEVDQSVTASFTFTPTEAGSYTVHVTSDPIDCQCNQTNKQILSASKSFEVLSTSPQGGVCYTLLNGLTLSPIFPQPGSQVTISGARLSQLSENITFNGSVVGTDLEQLPTNLTLEIYDSTGALELTSSQQLPPVAVQDVPEPFSFTWTPSKEDVFTIKVDGIGDDSRCVISNLPEEVNLTTGVTLQNQTYDLEFTVTNVQGNPISGAAVEVLGNVLTTNAQGIATFNIPSATYNYNVSASGFISRTGNVIVNGANTFITVILQPQGSGAGQTPVVGDIPDVYMFMNSVLTPFDLDNFVVDPDNTPAQMTWTFAGSNNVQVTINSDNTVTFTDRKSVV